MNEIKTEWQNVKIGQKEVNIKIRELNLGQLIKCDKFQKENNIAGVIAVCLGIGGQEAEQMEAKVGLEVYESFLELFGESLQKLNPISKRIEDLLMKQVLSEKNSQKKTEPEQTDI